MGARVIVVTSGKGGVGKTTTTANIGAGLADKGHKVLLIDTDIGLRNLDVVMGLENRIVYDIVDVIEGKCKLRLGDEEFIASTHESFYFLATSEHRISNPFDEECEVLIVATNSYL